MRLQKGTCGCNVTRGKNDLKLCGNKVSHRWARRENNLYLRFLSNVRDEIKKYWIFVTEKGTQFIKTIYCYVGEKISGSG